MRVWDDSPDGLTEGWTLSMSTGGHSAQAMTWTCHRSVFRHCAETATVVTAERGYGAALSRVSALWDSSHLQMNSAPRLGA